MAAAPGKKINQGIDSLDLDKLKAIIRKNWYWIFALVLSTNLAAYLVLRWTKDLYQSQSEIKLEINSNASGFGFKTFIEDENINLLSGEIEQIKSKVFLRQVIDSLDLGVSYFIQGNVLSEEQYRRSPFSVVVIQPNTRIENTPIHIKFDKGQITLAFEGTAETITTQPYTIFTFKGATLRIDLKAPPPPPNIKYFFTINSLPSLHEYISKNLSVEPINFSAKIIRISFSEHNPLKAWAVVSTIDSLYLNYSNRMKNQASLQKIQWLNEELVDIEKKMELYENYFENFSLQNRSNDLASDFKAIILQITAIDSQRYFNAKNINQINALIPTLTSNNIQAISAKAFLPDAISKKIELLQVKYGEVSKLSLAYNDNTYAYRQKQIEIDQLKDDLFNSIQALKQEWLKKQSDLDNTRLTLEQRFNAIPNKNTEFGKNQRFYKLYEEFYLSLMQSKAEFEISQAGTTPDFRILSPATLPSVPIAPKRIVIKTVGLVGGIALAFFFVGVAYLAHNKITSVREIENSLDLPVLGLLPENKHAAKTPFYIAENSKSRLAESLRNLRTNLDFIVTNQQKKVIAVSSSISGEGKTFVARNLAGVLALSNKKVILVDLDLRKVKLPASVSTPNQNFGVSTVLIHKSQWQDCITETPIQNLDYLPNGPIPPNPAELLMNGAFEKLLGELKLKYDFIVLDTPPAGLVTEGIGIMKQSDLSVYVFRNNYSNKNHLKTLERIQTINKISNLAIVFNSYHPPKNDGYGYYTEDEPKNRILKFFKT